jgi:hypothetical protein
MFQKVKGTQDFLDMSLYNFIVDSLRKHLSLYHFSEISTPVLEPTELFKRSLGVQTDVVSKEMFTIKSRARHSTLRATAVIEPLSKGYSRQLKRASAEWANKSLWGILKGRAPFERTVQRSLRKDLCRCTRSAISQK